jgi:hypothetical protein
MPIDSRIYGPRGIPSDSIRAEPALAAISFLKALDESGQYWYEHEHMMLFGFSRMSVVRYGLGQAALFRPDIVIIDQGRYNETRLLALLWSMILVIAIVLTELDDRYLASLTVGSMGAILALWVSSQIIITARSWRIVRAATRVALDESGD